MCRLLGFVSREATSLPSALGTDFDEFTKLSLGLHADGWGVATAPITAAPVTALPVGSAPGIRLGIDAAHGNPDFFSAASAPSAASLVHLRAATLGLPVSIENTHPFAHGEWSFAHNGSIGPIDAIESLIDPALLPSLKGDTDSERYLLAIMSQLPRLGVVDALRTVVAQLDEIATEASVNALLLGPSQLIVVADDSAKSPDFLGPDYYELSYRVGPDFVAVSSSGWHKDGWHRVPPRTILTVDRDSLALEFHELDAAASVLHAAA